MTDALPQKELPQAPPSSDALGRLLGDPELGERIGRILSSVTAQNAEQPSPTTESASTVASAEGSASTLAPALAGMLPALLSSLGGASGALPAAGGAGGRKGPPDEREALLAALRPFLSPARRDAVDTVLRLLKLGNLLQGLQGDRERS